MASARTEYRTHDDSSAAGFGLKFELTPAPGISFCETEDLSSELTVTDSIGTKHKAVTARLTTTENGQTFAIFTTKKRPTGSKFTIEGTLNLNIAINYGGRDEIVRAVKNIAERVKAGEIAVDDISEELVSDSLDTKGIPEPDLLIRTCNEQRISNFLLWQLAYTEFYFTEVAWPDFSKEELTKAIEAYNKRDRKYGLVKEE